MMATSAMPALMAATVDDLNQDAGMAAAVAAAANALAKEPLDDAHGAYCWDGADIKTNDANPAKVLGGIHFTDPQHKRNIKDKELPGATWWVDAKGTKTKLRGKWRYKYESTAGWGGTIFWQYNADFVKASGNQVYK